MCHIYRTLVVCLNTYIFNQCMIPEDDIFDAHLLQTNYSRVSHQFKWIDCQPQLNSYDCMSAEKPVEEMFQTTYVACNKHNFTYVPSHTWRLCVCFGNKLTFELLSLDCMLWVRILCFDFSGLLLSIPEKL